MDPAAIVEAIYAAVGANDIESAVSFLADDAVLVLIPPPEGIDGTFIGKVETGEWYEGLAADNGRAEFSNISVAGNTATLKLLWTSGYFDSLGIGPAEFDGAVVVQNGLLKSVSWVFTPEFSARMEAAMVREANKDIARRYLEAWEQADLTVLDEFIAEDVVNHSPPLPPDREGMKEFAAEHRREVPTGEYTIHQIVAEDDLVFIYSHFQGPDDESSFFWSTLLRLKDGKIVERWGT